jgi:hypothetical protein
MVATLILFDDMVADWTFLCIDQDPFRACGLINIFAGPAFCSITFTRAMIFFAAFEAVEIAAATADWS